MATLPPAPVWNRAKESRAEYMKRYNAWHAQLEAIRAARYAQVAQSHHAPATVVHKAVTQAVKAIQKAATVAPKPAPKPTYSGTIEREKEIVAAAKPTTTPSPAPKPPAQTTSPPAESATIKPSWNPTEPAPKRKAGEPWAAYKARYDEWRQKQDLAHQAAKVELAKRIIAESTASPTLKASEITLQEAGLQQLAGRVQERIAEEKRKAAEDVKIAQQQHALDVARAQGKISYAQVQRLKRELATQKQKVATEQYKRSQAAEAKQRWIENRKNQLIEEARQAMIRATGRVLAPEQEGRVIAQAIKYAQAEYDYQHGLRSTPPPESEIPRYDLSKPSTGTGGGGTSGTTGTGGGGTSGTTPPPTELSPAETYDAVTKTAAAIESQQASTLLSTQQAAYDQATSLYQLFSRLAHELPIAQGPVILESPEAGKPSVPIPTPSQLPGVLLGIAGGAVLVAGLMGR